MLSPKEEDAPWPVDLDHCRLWPMESEDGPLLQELLDDLTDFSTAFGDRGAADAVSTFVALPEGVGYDAKLLVGVWRNGGLVGALDCIMGYPGGQDWTVGMLVVAERHRRHGVASEIVSWLETTAAGRGARRIRAVPRRRNDGGRAFGEQRGYVAVDPMAHPDVVVVERSLK